MQLCNIYSWYDFYCAYVLCVCLCSEAGAKRSRQERLVSQWTPGAPTLVEQYGGLQVLLFRDISSSGDGVKGQCDLEKKQGPCFPDDPN